MPLLGTFKEQFEHMLENLTRLLTIEVRFSRGVKEQCLGLVVVLGEQNQILATWLNIKEAGQTGPPILPHPLYLCSL